MFSIKIKINVFLYISLLKNFFFYISGWTFYISLIFTYATKKFPILCGRFNMCGNFTFDGVRDEYTIRVPACQ